MQKSSIKTMSKSNICIGIGGGTLLIGILSLIALNNRETYDQDGYIKLGFDRQGFNEVGYNKKGFNSSGFNSKGFDKNGFDFEGYDSNGFNNKQIDREGYNNKGFNQEGYNREGFDKLGYDFKGFNNQGLDRGGKNRDYYNGIVYDMKNLEVKSKERIKSQDFAYALCDIRVGMEMGLINLLHHYIGDKYITNNNFKNISECEQHEIIDAEFARKLNEVRKYCNDNLHFNEKIDTTYNQMHFSHKVLGELIELIERFAS
ncbi:MAG: hypothetical protein LCH34_10290 [Firmicutes bacterium]|nr:hypothetical protein [Bacillota bacterium]